MYGIEEKNIWERIMEGRVTSPDQIWKGLFPECAEKPGYVQMLLLRLRSSGNVEMEEEKEVQPICWEDMRGFFEESSIHVTKGESGNECIILRKCQKQQFSFEITPELDAWLFEHDAVLCVGSATRDLLKIKTLYYLLQQMYRLAGNLAPYTVRVHRIEEYQSYMMIDHLANDFLYTHGHDDVMYLAHPAVVHITRYDRKNGTDLMKVLFQYLRYGGNMQKTADALFMHRNTVLYKMKKINEIVQLDLEDGLLCQQLLLSCQLLEYEEKVMRRNIPWER